MDAPPPPPHMRATTALAFYSLLPTTQSDRQVSNDCHIRLLQVTIGSLCYTSHCQGNLVHLHSGYYQYVDVRGDGLGFQGGKPPRQALGAYAKQPVSMSVSLSALLRVL